MGGGHHQSASEVAVFDRPREQRGRAVALGQENVEPVGREHAGELLGEPTGGPAGVVAHRDRRVVARFLEVGGDPLAHHPHPGCGEGVEGRAPAVGAERDRVHALAVSPANKKLPVGRGCLAAVERPQWLLPTTIR
jgi:hypothetical protein